MGMRRSRIFQLAAFAVVLLFVGAKAYRHVQLRRMSPFVLWEFRAGSSFQALEKSAFRQTKQRFTCHQIIPTARLCEMRVTGIAGLVRVLVNARERVAAVQFLPDSASAAMREESRRVTAEWNLVRAGATDPTEVSGSTSTVTRWRSIDGKWGAVIRSSNGGARPAILHLSDATALAELVSSAPLSSLVLALNQLAESADLGNVDDVSEVLGTIVYGRAIDRANETPAPTIAPTLPLCEPERADPIVAATPGSVDRYSAPAMELLERAIPMLYPGSRLTFGDGVWIVDATGRSELVRIGRSESGDTPQDGIIYSIQFTGRQAVALQRLEDGVADRRCRAPAELIFARANEDGSLAEAHRLPVDQEAITSTISRISLFESGTAGAEPEARVRYTAWYAGQDWVGSIEWEAVVVDDPPRTTGRVPLMLERRAQGAEEALGGSVIVTGRPAGGIELSTLEEHKWGFATRTFVVPVDASGVLLGTSILDGQF